MIYLITLDPRGPASDRAVRCVSVDPAWDIVNMGRHGQIVPGKYYVSAFLMGLDHDIPDLGGWTRVEMPVNYLGTRYKGRLWIPNKWQQYTDTTGVRHDRAKNLKEWVGP